MSVGAILLAGGRASRVDGADKALLEVGGRTLLDAALDAARMLEAAPLVVVGPPRVDLPGVRWAREDPPFGGPAAGVVAGLRAAEEASPEWTLVLACDLPRAAEAVTLLHDAARFQPAEVEGVCLADASGRPQWLTALYRTRALRAVALALPDAGRDAPARALVDGLAIATVNDPDGRSRDVDTWDDLNRAREES